MKYIKLRILAVIWVALLLLFSAFFLILYLLLPKHFRLNSKSFSNLKFDFRALE